MSINWLMVSPGTNPPFTPLPNESVQYTSPGRVEFSLKTPAHYPGRQQQPFSRASDNGITYVTNQRVIYIPDKPTQELQNFNASILNVMDAHEEIPWWGPMVWTAAVRPVQGGGIPIPPTGVVEVKLKFREGGAHDFHLAYERIKERIQQQVEVTRVNDNGPANSRAAASGVDFSNVNLEDLPAYTEESDGPLIPPTAAAVQTSALQQQRDSGIGMDSDDDGRPRLRPTDNALNPPDEPPPGYEETQMAGLQDELERRLQSERQ